MIMRFFIIWLGVGLLEWPWIQVVLWQDAAWVEAHFAAAIALHLVAALVMGLVDPRGAGWLSLGRRWSLGLSAMVLAMPFFGWLFSGVLFLGYVCRPVHPLTSGAEDDLIVEEGAVFVTRERSYDRISRELDFIPLADILTGSSLALKRGAIEKLQQLRTPEAIGILKSYRSDASVEIRFFVNSALTEIKKQFDEELEAAKEEMKRNITQSAARLTLAKVYIQYAGSGLLDESSTQVFEAEAIYHLNDILQKGSPSAEVYDLLVECYMQRQDWEKALEIANQEEMVQKKAIILYHLKRFSEISPTLKMMGAEMTPKWVAASTWWGAGHGS